MDIEQGDLVFSYLELFVGGKAVLANQAALRLLLVAFATAEDPLQRLLLRLGSTVLTPLQSAKSWRWSGTTFQSKCITTTLQCSVDTKGYEGWAYMDAVTKLREKHIDVKKGQKRPLLRRCCHCCFWSGRHRLLKYGARREWSCWNMRGWLVRCEESLALKIHESETKQKSSQSCGKQALDYSSQELSSGQNVWTIWGSVFTLCLFETKQKYLALMQNQDQVFWAKK